MKYNRYLLLLLLLCISICTRAQYNPENPDEPGARPWKLTLQANPAKAESFNRSKDTYHVAGEQIYIQAYDNGGFKFVKWEDEQGNVISTERGFDYTMPARHVTLARHARRARTGQHQATPLPKKQSPRWWLLQLREY